MGRQEPCVRVRPPYYACATSEKDPFDLPGRYCCTVATTIHKGVGSFVNTRSSIYLFLTAFAVRGDDKLLTLVSAITRCVRALVVDASHNIESVAL